MLLNKNGIITLVALVDMLLSDGYKVVDKAEILAAIEGKMDIDALNISLRELKERGYIKVKFNDLDEICLAINAISRDTVAEMRKVEVERMTRAAIVTKNTKGETIVTSVDDTPAFEEDKTVVADNLPTVVEPMPIVVGKIKKPKRPTGRIATFFIGTFGGLCGSGIVAGIVYLLTTLGIM